MERVAFTMSIKPGHEAEYRRRHQAVWPEMLKALKEAGCHNYSIYARGLDLFAYMEVDSFSRFLAVMEASDANRRWQAFMSDILEVDPDPTTNFPFALAEVFHLD